jgi:hypothetical protein
VLIHYFKEVFTPWIKVAVENQMKESQKEKYVALPLIVYQMELQKLRYVLIYI